MNIQSYQSQNLMRSRACFIKGGVPYLSLSCKITRMLEYAVTSFVVKVTLNSGAWLPMSLFSSIGIHVPPPLMRSQIQASPLNS
jgi:hypothetical protein